MVFVRRLLCLPFDAPDVPLRFFFRWRKKMHWSFVGVLLFAAGHATTNTDTAIRLLAVACIVYLCTTTWKDCGGHHIAWVIVLPTFALTTIGNIYEATAKIVL